MTLNRNTRSYTLQSAPSSPGRSFLFHTCSHNVLVMLLLRHSHYWRRSISQSRCWRNVTTPWCDWKWPQNHSREASACSHNRRKFIYFDNLSWKLGSTMKSPSVCGAWQTWGLNTVFVLFCGCYTEARRFYELCLQKFFMLAQSLLQTDY